MVIFEVGAPKGNREAPIPRKGDGRHAATSYDPAGSQPEGSRPAATETLGAGG